VRGGSGGGRSALLSSAWSESLVYVAAWTMRHALGRHCRLGRVVVRRPVAVDVWSKVQYTAHAVVGA